MEPTTDESRADAADEQTNTPHAPTTSHRCGAPGLTCGAPGLICGGDGKRDESREEKK